MPGLLLCLCLYLLAQTSSACTPHAHIMHGIGLGKPIKSRANSVKSWRTCCDLCSNQNGCVAWTFLRTEKACLFRDKVGTNFNLEAKDRVSCIMNSSLLPVIKRDDTDVWFHVGILSAPNNNARREKLRKKCLPKFAKKFNNHRLTYEFVIGRPHHKLPSGKIQGYIEREEASRASLLWKEQQNHGDIHFMPSRDTYIDLPTKTLEVIKRGVLRRARYIIKMDDDKCLDPDKLQKLLDKNHDPEYGYFAIFLWNTKYYNSQLGVDKKFAKYMSGPLYGLTFPLARLITFDDSNYAAMYPMYGSSSEDVDMGRWVEHAMTAHNITVKYMTGQLT